jgi:agmatine deiminase
VEILQSSTDARGRQIEVVKVPCPPPMFRTHHEADTVDVSMEFMLRSVGITEH